MAKVVVVFEMRLYGTLCPHHLCIHPTSSPLNLSHHPCTSLEEEMEEKEVVVMAVVEGRIGRAYERC